MSTKEEFILEVAHCVRSWAQEYVKKARQYEFYRQDDLSCMCAFASTLLLGCLHHFGIENVKIVAGDLHVFLRVNDKILDITATQFKLNEGALGHYVEHTSRSDLLKRYAYSADYWTEIFVFDTVQAAFEGMAKYGFHAFPEDQYWSRFSDLRKSLNRVIKYCEESGIVHFSQRASAEKLAA